MRLWPRDEEGRTWRIPRLEAVDLFWGNGVKEAPGSTNPLLKGGHWNRGRGFWQGQVAGVVGGVGGASHSQVPQGALTALLFRIVHGLTGRDSGPTSAVTERDAGQSESFPKVGRGSRGWTDGAIGSRISAVSRRELL